MMPSNTTRLLFSDSLKNLSKETAGLFNLPEKIFKSVFSLSWSPIFGAFFLSTFAALPSATIPVIITFGVGSPSPICEAEAASLSSLSFLFSDLESSGSQSLFSGTGSFLGVCSLKIRHGWSVCGPVMGNIINMRRKILSHLCMWVCPLCACVMWVCHVCLIMHESMCLTVKRIKNSKNYQWWCRSVRHLQADRK